MSSENLVEMSENLFGLEHIVADNETNNTLIFEEITRKLEAYLLEESDDTDSTDGVFDFLISLADQVQEEFEELLDSNSDKKRFLRTLSKISLCFLTQKLTPPKK